MVKEIIVDEKREQKQKKEDAQTQINEKILSYRILQGRLEEIRREADMLERKFFETESTRQFLEDVQKGEKEIEMLMPIGNGFFAKGVVTDKKLLMDIGAGIFANKSIEGSEVVLNNMKTEIEETVNKLNEEMSRTVEKLNGIASDVRKIQEDLGIGHMHN